ncbi:potassium-transporting ATPase subunit KdpC [Paenibacillus albicereus]|uniref:Potassium-transporting ATPase KdpC subunit n=1 Tax=Paenibacillus albicereus TaxID=2726185 RepID=A0A6H2GWE6_9BACL|nr:potassium-transporting ATPase subunit KdpC [Paenibacillus albicereus]QJC51712.1 potassium-transporting ATPase subunit KdpC [Paenibacillus albicereus]
MQLVTTSLRVSLVLMALCGLIYNLAVTGIAQGLMPHKADGSLIEDSSGRIVGSAHIGQTFTEPRWFHGRLSSIGYAADGSGTPNYAPSNPDLLERARQSAIDWQAANPAVPLGQVTADLITNSGSGLDPDISPEGARAQIPRVSAATGIPAAELEKLVERQVEPRQLGVFGEPTVNVLELNLALQALASNS